MKKEAWVSVAEIYRQGIEIRNAIFETEIPTHGSNWIQRI